MPSNDAPAPTGALVRHSAWTINRRVIGALVLREMLTRYGRNNIGFLWLFVEPILFTSVLVMVRATRIGIYHDAISGVAFAMTGWPTLMLWRNMPNRCMGALRSNRTLLHHRQVTITDLFYSRVILEFMATSTSFVFLSIGLCAVGWLMPPEDILKVIAGWFLLAWFGFGLALTIGSLSERYPVIQSLWRAVTYVFMPISGVAYLVDSLPQQWHQLALWIPMINGVELLRDGWFGSLFDAHYDIGYFAICNLCLMFVGLSLLRQVGSDPAEE